MSRPNDLRSDDTHAPYFTIAADNFGGVAFWAALERLSAGHQDHQRYLVGDSEHVHRYRWSCACSAVLAVVDVLAGTSRDEPR